MTGSKGLTLPDDYLLERQRNGSFALWFDGDRVVQRFPAGTTDVVIESFARGYAAGLADGYSNGVRAGRADVAKQIRTALMIV